MVDAAPVEYFIIFLGEGPHLAGVVDGLLDVFIHELYYFGGDHFTECPVFLLDHIPRTPEEVCVRHDVQHFSLLLVEHVVPKQKDLKSLQIPLELLQILNGWTNEYLSQVQRTAGLLRHQVELLLAL